MVYPNRVVLNINQKYVMPIPYTQQRDTARVLTFNILDNGVPFSLQGKTVRARIAKPDKTKCYNDLTITNATNGECTLKLTNQILAVAGNVNCQLEIKEGEELLSTIIFSIDVEPSIDISGAVESTNEFTALENGIIKLDEWDKYFKETSGAIEEKYTERLNGIASSLEDIAINIEQFGAIGDGITDDSDAIINCFKNANGKTVNLKHNKTYLFKKEINIEGLKDCTINFNGSSFKDGGKNIVCINTDTNKEVNNKNPLGIEFTNFENLTLSGLNLDTNQFQNYSWNIRVPHEKVREKRANISFEYGKNLKIINPKIIGWQGTYIQGGFVQDDENKLPKQLEFSYVKIFDVENVELINTDYKGKNVAEVFGLGKCKNVHISSVAKNSELLASLFKCLQCDNITFDNMEYKSDDDKSFADVSGDLITFKNFNVEYPHGKFVDTTNEWGVSSGTIGTVNIEDSNIDSLITAFVSVHKYENLQPYPYISHVEKLNVNNCILGNLESRDYTGLKPTVIPTPQLYKEINIINTTVNNMNCLFGSVNFNEAYLEKNKYKVNIENCTFNTTLRFFNNGGEDLFCFYGMGDTKVKNCIFNNENSYIHMLIGDSLVSKSLESFPSNLKHTDTRIVFDNCTFINQLFEIRANIKFINCTFKNCRFKSRADGEYAKVEGDNNTFIWEDLKDFDKTDVYTSASPFALTLAEEIGFTNSKFIGNIKGNSIVHPSPNCNQKIIFRKCDFDISRITDENGVLSYCRTFVVNNKSDVKDYELCLEVDNCNFNNNSIPLTLNGDSSSTRTKIHKVIMTNNKSNNINNDYAIEHRKTLGNNFTKVDVVIVNNQLNAKVDVHNIPESNNYNSIILSNNIKI